MGMSGLLAAEPTPAVAKPTRRPAPPLLRPVPSAEAARPTGAGPRWSFGGLAIRPKLTVGAVDDPQEREADAMAEQVMRMPAPGAGPPVLRRTCAACAEEERTLRRKCSACENEERLHRAPATAARPAAAEAPASVHAALDGAGHAMDPVTRGFFEPAFGRDLGHVRLHTGAAAAQSARDVGALAYTVGSDIVFGAGQFAPHSADGRKLLAHELTHVMQVSGQHAAVPAARTLRRQPQGDDTPTADADSDAAAAGPPMSRAEEIQLSRSSPGEYIGQPSPLTLSLYNFAIDVPTPKPEHDAVLQDLGRFLGARATVPVTVRAAGFADATGGKLYNLDLSRRRADAVRAVLQPLVSQHVSVTGYGETNPAASNDTVSGRSRNRRVDLRFDVDTPTPQPQPGPQPQPPSGGDGGTDDRHFCDSHPWLCGAGITPFLLPLVCLVAPEICAALGCALQPELCVPPIPPPGPPETPQPPKKQPADGGPSVTFVPTTRADNTPGGMPDRIGLRDPVYVTAVVVAPQPLTAPITIEVDGVGKQAGDATVNGGHSLPIMATTALEIRGVAMSAAGYAFSPFLQLAAWYSGSLVGAGNRFGVSAIMQDWKAELEGAETTRFGHAFYARMSWESDSGARRDLNACRYVERVAVVSESGGLIGMGPGEVSDPNVVETGDLSPTFDQHGTPHEWTRRAGHSLIRQVFTIRDMRVNGNWVASRNSGFEIERDVRRDVDDPLCWQLTVTKRGAPVAVAPFSSDAGTGVISHRFSRLNCETPPPPPPPPTPIPTPTPTPAPSGQQPGPAPPCDKAELGRRVDACIAQARQGVIGCTLGIFPFTGGWGGVGSGFGYLDCLEWVKALLLECDRRAKRDTHCEEGGHQGDDQEGIASAAGLPPEQTG